MYFDIGIRNNKQLTRKDAGFRISAHQSAARLPLQGKGEKSPISKKNDSFYYDGL
jgi:hypothetical protein